MSISRLRRRVVICGLAALSFCRAAAISLVAQDATPLDTRGPVVTPGMTVQVDEHGVQAPGYSYSQLPAKSSWTASWIDSSGPGISSSVCRLVRKPISLAEEPVKIDAWLTSEGSYLLYINGKQAARGPADAGRDFANKKAVVKLAGSPAKGSAAAGAKTGRWFYDCRDFTGLLHRGENVLAAELSGSSGFLFEADVHFANGKTEVIRSDASWKGEPSPFLKSKDLVPGTGKKKIREVVFDAVEEPLNWQAVGFEDTQWLACKLIPPPPYPLAQSQLPPLMEVRYPVFDLTAVSGGASVPAKPFKSGHPVMLKADGDFTVHFNKIMAGRCGIAVKGVKGATLTLTSNETDSQGGRVYELHLRDGLQYFEAPDYYALGTIHVAARGVTAPIEIEDVSAVFQSQPVAYQGAFTCSDEQLNKLWESCRWSTQICMMTHHLDSPQHQEPISDYGDYLIADLVNYCSMGNNPWLARQDLRKFAWIMQNAKYRTFHTSYTLLWLQALLNYYDYTGDKSVIDELAPTVHGLIDQFTTYIGANGIVSNAPNYMFMDWVQINHVACHHPPAVIGQGYMTAFFYKGLADALRVSSLTGDTAHAAAYTALRRQVAEAYNRELWNPEQGLYRDGKPYATTVKPNSWLPADTTMETFSVQNNALALLYDLAPPERRQSVVRKMMMTSPLNVTPYFMHFVLSSIAHAGLFDTYGVEQMHAWHIVPETQTVLEMGTSGDHSHGWIASPLYQMSSEILGIKPTSPAFKTVAIRPHLCGLAYARGTVPSPLGDIRVDWVRKGSGLTLKVALPPGARAALSFPVGDAGKAQITLAGKTIWNSGAAGTGIAGVTNIVMNGAAVDMQLAPGSYEFSGTGLSETSTP